MTDFDVHPMLERDRAECPTPGAILIFRSPARAEDFCREAKWDFQSNLLIYPVSLDDLPDGRLTEFTIIVDDHEKDTRFPGMTEMVWERLKFLADVLEVPVVEAGDVVDGW